MSDLSLCRMTIEEAAFQSAKVAASTIHEQTSYRGGAVGVETLARTLDIISIEPRLLDGFEGAVLFTEDRREGAILVNARSSRQRQRFTIAHELMHFLCVRHEPKGGGVRCPTHTIGRIGKRARADAQKAFLAIEREANVFATELLMPRRALRPYLRQDPHLGVWRTAAKELDVSFEALARRMVDLDREAVAVVFVRGGRVRYTIRSSTCPWLAVQAGDSVTSDLDWVSNAESAKFDAVDPADWLADSDGPRLDAQALVQSNGYGTILLRVETRDDAEDDVGVEDAYERFTRFGR